MRLIAALFLVLVSAPLSALEISWPSGNVSATHYQAETAGDLVVRPDGSVGDVTFAQLTGAPAEAYRTAIEMWKFEPILEDGIPVSAIVSFRMALRAQRVPGTQGLRLTIEHVWLDDPVAQREAAGRSEMPLVHTPAPTYPMTAAQRGVGAELELLVKLDSEGRVTDAEVLTAGVFLEQLHAGSRRAARANVAEFSEAALRRAQDWRIRDAEALKFGSVRVPVVFLPPGERGERWLPVIPLDVAPGPLAAAQVAEVPNFEGRQYMAGRFKLLTKVSGQTLN